MFPPMDKNTRTMVHELSNKFNIKSKSIGSGEQRRPTLYRTVRTTEYSESTFEQVISRNRKFPRLNTKNKHGKATSARQAFLATSYQDGEIVGASAPELGAENRGRAILEKMGWNSGTALGADDNKGIMQPVKQTMKRSKAGLG